MQGTPRPEAHPMDPCSAVCPVLRIVEDREGTLYKTGVKRTKDNDAGRQVVDDQDNTWRGGAITHTETRRDMWCTT